ncbi:MAG: hypothetical protein GWP27_08690 [Bacteroidetes bacterium]|nr:hypothetical protein [Bacteroidota bacterium]
MAIKGSNIEDLFREGLANHEMPVNPNVWTGVQASISAGAGASAAAGSSSLAMSLTSAAIVAALCTVAVIGEIQYQNQEVISANDKVEHVAADVDQKPTADTITRDEAKRVIAEIEATTEFVTTEIEIVNFEEIASGEEISELVVGTTPSSEVDETTPEMNNVTEGEPVKSEPQKDEAATGQSTDEGGEANKTANEEEPGLNEETPTNHEQQVEAISMVDLGIPEDGNITIAPGKGGLYDCFVLPYMNNVAEFQIEIFTREGVLLERTKDPMFRWCGTDTKGKTLEGTHTVYFIIMAFDYDGVQYKGRKTKSFITVIGN